MPNPPSGMPPSGDPSPQRKSSSWIVIGILLLLAAAVSAVILIRLFRPPTPEHPAAPPVEQEEVAPLLSPEIESLEEVKQYTTGRPTPAVSATRSPGWRTVNEHILGNPDARISIVEYTDFGNRYADLIHPEFKALVESNQQVNWIYRHYPLPDVEQSYPASFISECVWFILDDDTPDFFFQYVGDNFDLDNEAPTDEDYRMGAYSLGIPPEDLESCIAEPWVERVVKDHKRLGVIQGDVSVTPTFLLHDNLSGETRVIPGVDTIEYFMDVIVEMMERPVPEAE